VGSLGVGAISSGQQPGPDRVGSVCLAAVCLGNGPRESIRVVGSEGTIPAPHLVAVSAADEASARVARRGCGGTLAL